MRTLAVVPARAGSKGLPGKNKRDFCGKPLVAWAIECGKRTCDGVVVTSDDPEVLRIAETYGVKALKRPSELAQDDNPIIAVMLHALELEREIDTVVLLQPTQPLRRDIDVLLAIRKLSEDETSDSAATVVEFPRSCLPDKAVTVNGDWLAPLYQPDLYSTRRWQDCRQAYYRDGTAYVMRRRLLETGDMYGRARAVVVPREHSCDIDTEEDWARAERMWREQHGSV